MIGGGDWGRDRVMPAGVEALGAGRSIELRAPEAVRPWQHVLEPLGGYLELGVRLSAAGDAGRFSGAWNFGPHVEAMRPVRDLVELCIDRWGAGAWHASPAADGKHEASMLRLATDKAESALAWRPRWSLPAAVAATIDWYRAAGAAPAGRAAVLAALTRGQIAQYESDAAATAAGPAAAATRLAS